MKSLKDQLLNELGSSFGMPTDGFSETPAVAGPPMIPDHTLLRPIGKGSYGEVWLARTTLGTLRAAKIVYRSAFDSERPYEREFAGIRRFEPVSRTHPSQLNVLHVGRDDGAGLFYYIMELADNAATACTDANSAMPVDDPHSGPETYTPRTIRSEIQKRGRLRCAECVSIGTALATALDHLHRHGLVHRDIKPSNIIFLDGIPKLADIGLVTHMEATLSFVGTEGYLPPEGPGTPQADIYSLGKVLYEMVTGRDRQDYPELPSDFINAPAAERAELAEFNEVIVKACHADAKERYQTAAELHADLALLQSGKSVSRMRAIERRLKFVARAGALVTGVAVVAGGLYLWQAQQTRFVSQLVQEKELARQQAQAGLYVADIQVAYHDWQSGQIPGMLHRLRRHIPQGVEPDLRGWEWYFLLSLCHRDERTLRGHTDTVTSVSCEPGGKRFASASKDRMVRIWDANSWVSLAELSGHGDSVRCVGWSPNGGQLASGSQDGKVILWEVDTGRKRHVLNCDGQILALAWSPNGTQIAAGGMGQFPAGREGLVTIWDAESGARLHSLTGHVRQIWSLAWHPNGKHLAAGESYEGRLQVWDAGKGELLRTVQAHDQYLAALAWKSDGRQLASASADQSVRVWDADTWQPVVTIEKAHNGYVTSLVWSEDGQRLVSGGYDGLVKIWSSETGNLLNTLRGHQGPVQALSRWPDHSRVLSGGDDASLKIWSTDSRLATRTLEDCWAFEWSLDGRQVAVCRGGGLENPSHVEILDSITWQRSLSLPGVLGTVPYALTWSSDGRRLAVLYDCEDEGHMRAWDVDSRRPLLTLTNRVPDHNGNHGFARSCWSPDGQLLALAGMDTAVRIYQPATQRLVLEFREHATSVTTAVWSPDGRLIASKDYFDGVVLIWEAQTGKVMLRLQHPAGHDAGAQRCVVWNRTGNRLATTAVDGAIRIWDTLTGQEVHTLRGHTSRARSVDWSPDGRRLVSTAEDRTIRIWDAEGGHELMVLAESDYRVSKVAWSPDGRQFSVVGRSARIFDASLGYHFAPALSRERTNP